MEMKVIINLTLYQPDPLSYQLKQSWANLIHFGILKCYLIYLMSLITKEIVIVKKNCFSLWFKKKQMKNLNVESILA